MNKNLLFSVIGLIFLGIFVSRIKYEVVFLRKHLIQLRSDISKISDDLKVYGAEWSYLNNPKRLKQLASKYLPQMKPMESKQILSYNEFVRNEYEDQLHNRKKAFDDFLKSIL